jgi:hypothetical protein
MKNTIKTLILATMIAFSFPAFAQDWNTSGNNSGSSLKLGVSDAGEGIDFTTQSQTRMSLTSSGWLAVGITAPRGWQELNYCPDVGNAENGLIVTLNKCNGNVAQNLGDYEVIGFGLPGVDPEISTFTPPLSYLTGSNTNIVTPLYGTASANNSPMFWVRQQSPNGFWTTSGPDEFDTKFIVMPDGSCGINIAKPRAALDVRGSNGDNYPAAIIGARSLGYNVVSGGLA